MTIGIFVSIIKRINKLKFIKMKKITTLFAIAGLTLFSTFSFAQRGTLSLGFKGGATFNSFSEFALSSADIMGVDAGIFAIYSSDENRALSLDLLYSQAGGLYSINNFGSVNSKEVKLNYFKLVPKFNYFFRDFDDEFRPKVNAGFSLGFLTDADDRDSNAELDDDFQAIDLGLVLGTGFNYELADAIWLNFDVYYTLGLTDANDTPFLFPEREVHNNSLGMSVGLAFGLSRVDDVRRDDDNY